MVKFLIHRPIAVIMTFIAILLLGGVAAGLLPVSLMPDIDIPEITVQVNYSGRSVQEIESGVAAVFYEFKVTRRFTEEARSNTERYICF